MFTADQARNVPFEAKFQRELAANDRHIEGVASNPNPREVEHHRKIGVLVYDGGDLGRMQIEMQRRGFATSLGQFGQLRVYW